MNVHQYCCYGEGERSFLSGTCFFDVHRVVGFAWISQCFCSFCFPKQRFSHSLLSFFIFCDRLLFINSRSSRVLRMIYIFIISIRIRIVAVTWWTAAVTRWAARASSWLKMKKNINLKKFSVITGQLKIKILIRIVKATFITLYWWNKVIS